MPSQEDIVPLAHNGRNGVWFEEQAWGDTLAGIEREKGEERTKRELESMRRELAEKQVREITASIQPWAQWVKYGLSSLLAGVAGGMLFGFLMGRR